jgi:hypothetical protein
MVKVDLSHYSLVSDGIKTDWFKLVSEGGYVSECRLRTGDEDQRVIDLFLNFTNPPLVYPNFLNGFNEDRKRKLEERIRAYNNRFQK